jgi:hypothetical protein
MGMRYILSQPLPILAGMHTFIGGDPALSHPQRAPPPAPHLWTPKYIPENYTDGSKIDGHPRLGASVVHIPTATTIYIDAAGTEETRTILRAELVAIHTALTTLASLEWTGVFTDSLSNL